MSGSNQYLLNQEMIKAAMRDDILDLKKYVKRGAEVNFYSMDEYSTAIYFAIHKGNIEMIDFLIQNGADLNLRGRYRDPPLHIAVNRNDKNLVQYFLDKGFDINTINNVGLTCFHMAIYRGNYEIIELLLSYNIDLNYSTYSGSSYFHYLCSVCAYNDGIDSNWRKIYSLLLKTYFNIPNPNYSLFLTQC